MALILTLGLLAVITLAVVSFVVTIRIERLAASNTLNRTMARQYIDIGLSAAMEAVDYYLLVDRPSPSSYPVQGWDPTTLPPPYFQEQDCLGLGSSLPSGDSSISLFCGSATNLLPGVLAAQASQVLSGWHSITATNNTTGANGITNGRVAFLIVNLSGMMDVHTLTNSYRCAALNEPTANVTNLLNSSAYQRVFLTQPDLTAANGGPVSNLVTFSYDPNPDVVFINANSPATFGTRAFGGLLTNRFNINSATNFNTLPNYAAMTTCAVWLATVSNLLGSAGVPYADQVAWNILNYIDPNPQRTPVVDPAGPPCYRTGYGVKDVPLINEVVLQDVSAAGTSNHYGVAVELWYPFVPNASQGNCTLWVGIYTNANAVSAEFSAFNNNLDSPPTPLGFEISLPQMNYGSNEFFVGATTNTAGATPVVFAQPVVDSYGPPLVTHTNYLPVSADHPIWIWPRVYVGGACVDEALVNATLGASSAVWQWTNACSVQFADPRANNTLAYASFTNAPSLGTTNTNCSVFGLPLVQADAPMLSAGELRHIYAPGMSNACLDFATSAGAACRDLFTVRSTTNSVHGLVQANTPYTNIWKALLCDIPVGWTNSTSASTQRSLAPDELAGAAEAAANAARAGIPNSQNLAGSWNCFSQMLPMVASSLNFGNVTTINGDAFSERGDILAGIADRVSFRQNTFLVIVCSQRLSPLGRVLADQRAAITVVRDAFTGRWVVDHVVWLTE